MEYSRKIRTTLRRTPFKSFTQMARKTDTFLLSSQDYLVIQEDGGNKFGERMFIAKIPAPGKKPIYHFIA